MLPTRTSLPDSYVRGMERIDTPQTLDTVIVGAGQAGLSTAYHLRRLGLDCLVLESAHQVGDHWRHKYDSLRLFTANRFNRLPGLSFPGEPWGFAGKDDVAQTLQSYAARYDLPVRTDSPVRRVARDSDSGSGAAGFTVTTPTHTYRARTVVLATGPFGQLPRVPDLADDLDPEILQLHSSQYRRPGQLRPGPVLVVGGGHSGCDIALEVACAGHPTTLSGRDLGQIPVPFSSPLLRVIMPMVMLQHAYVLDRRTPMGRKMRPVVLHHGAPRLRVQAKDLDDAGVVRTEARVTGVHEGLPQLADGTVVEATNVVWATGLRHDWSWLDLPVLDEEGWPREFRGVAQDVDGLFFCGLAFQSSMSSMNFFGVGRDAAYVARRVAEQVGRQRVTV